MYFFLPNYANMLSNTEIKWNLYDINRINFLKTVYLSHLWSVFYLNKKLTFSLKLILIFSLLILICTLFFSQFQISLDKNLKESTQEKLSYNTQQTLYSLDKNYIDTFAKLKIQADTLSLHYDDITSNEALLYLSNQIDNHFLLRMAIMTSDGTSYTTDGKTQNNVSREYFKQALAGNNSISDVLQSSVDEKSIIVFAVPIHKDNTTIGVLRATYQSEYFSDLLKANTFDNTSLSIIISRSGNIIASTQNTQNQSNWLKILENANFQDDETLSHIIDNLADNKKNTIHYILNNQEYYANFQPVGLNDWYLFNIIPAETIAKQHREISTNALALCIKVLLLLLIVILATILYLKHSFNELQKSKNTLEATTNNINGVVIVLSCDENLTIKYANDSYYSMLNYTRDEIHIKFKNAFYPIIYPPDAITTFNSIIEQLKSTELISCEFRIRNKDGTIFWILLNGQCVNNQEDIQTPPTINCVFIDITPMKQTTQELETLTNSIPGGVAKIFIGSNISILFANDGYYELIGYTRDEYIALGKRALAKIIHPRDIDRVLSYLRANAHKNYPIKIEYRVVHKDKNISWVLLHGNRVDDEIITPVFQCVFIDITHSKELQRTLELESERYRTLAELSDDILFEYNFATKSISFSKKYEEVTGLNPPMKNIRKNFIEYQLIYDEDIETFLGFYDSFKNGASSGTTELRLNKRQGYSWYKLQAVTIFNFDKTPKLIIGKIANIDSHKQETDHLRKLAERDTLTQLYNHNTTISLINQYLNECDESSYNALIIIDIDNFKAINDTFGHLNGDIVLKMVSNNLRILFRSTDIIGRIGGDEFVVLLKNVASKEVLLKKATGICKFFHTIHLKDYPNYKISGSAGIAINPDNGSNYDELLYKADAALYKAKRKGKDCFALYDEY